MDHHWHYLQIKTCVLLVCEQVGKCRALESLRWVVSSLSCFGGIWAKTGMIARHTRMLKLSPSRIMTQSPLDLWPSPHGLQWVSDLAAKPIRFWLIRVQFWGQESGLWLSVAWTRQRPRPRASDAQSCRQAGAF